VGGVTGKHHRFCVAERLCWNSPVLSLVTRFLLTQASFWVLIVIKKIRRIFL
jgi:hypothetical protein